MKYNYLKFISVLVIGVSVATGCKEGTEDPIAFGYEYFPTDSGRYVQFKVDSIAWNDFTIPSTVDTFRFDIREINDSVFTDIAGEDATVLIRNRRDSANGAWYIKDVWSMKRTNARAEKVEENERIVKLTFPIVDGAVWNGNLYNTNDPWEYELTKIGEPFTVNGFTFNETVTVLQTGNNDIPSGQTEPLLNKQLGKEVYAKGVGLVYKELTILEANIVPGTPFDQRIKRGFKMFMVLTDYSPQ